LINPYTNEAKNNQWKHCINCKSLDGKINHVDDWISSVYGMAQNMKTETVQLLFTQSTGVQLKMLSQVLNNSIYHQFSMNAVHSHFSNGTRWTDWFWCTNIKLFRIHDITPITNNNELLSMYRTSLIKTRINEEAAHLSISLCRKCVNWLYNK